MTLDLKREIERAIRENVKVDASGIAPAVASVFMVGFGEATNAILALFATSPSPLPEGLDLAELKKLALAASQPDQPIQTYADFDQGTAPETILRLLSELETLAAENERLNTGGFTAKDGGQWVRKDRRDEAEARAEKAQADLSRALEALRQIADSGDSTVSALRLYEGCQEIAREALATLSKGGGNG